MAELIAGRYQVGASLGTGGMGEVFLATDTRLGRQVAIKRIRRPSGADSADPVGMQRLRREAQAAAIVHHPNVVTIHDLVDDGENLYVVMEYVKGQTLAALTRARSTVDPLTVGRIGAQIAGALEAAHRVGVIHRDVKPANILVDGDGTAKLADFGIARSVGDDPLTGTGLFIGSLLFMAPEVAGGGPATAASDVYSLGATLFAACEGHAPLAQPAAPPAELLARLLREPAPPASNAGPLAGLIGRMLATDPAQRPTAAETRHTLDRLILDLSSGTATWPDSRPETDTGAPVPSGWAATSGVWATPPAATVLPETPAAVDGAATLRRAHIVAAPAAPVLHADTPKAESITARPTAGDGPAELQPTVIAGTPRPHNVQTPATTGTRVTGQPKPRRRGLLGAILAITAITAVTAAVAGVAGLFPTTYGTAPKPTSQVPTTTSPTTTSQVAFVAWNQAFESYNNDTQDQNATANANITYLANDVIGYYDKDLKLAQNPSFGKYEKVSDSPLKVKVTLADTATWSDGTPVTAADVLLQWAALSTNLNTYEATVGDDGSVSKPNEGDQVYFNAASPGYTLMKTYEVGDNGKSVTFTYEKPFVDWEILAADPVGVAAHVVGKKALGETDNTKAAQAVLDAIKNKDNAKLAKISNFWNTGFKFMNMPADKDLVVGTGPFTITDAVENQFITLSKNPNYKGSHKPKVDKITVRFIADAQASVQALRNGEVLVTQPQATADILSQVKALGDAYTVQTGAGGTYEHVDMAVDNGGPFDPKAYGGDAAKAKAVRLAFLTSIPRQKIVDNLIKPLNPQAEIRNSFTTVPSAPSYAAISAANGMQAAFGTGDPAKGKEILARAGVTTAPTVRFLYASTNTRRQQEFQLIKEAAEQAGFKVEDKSAEKWGSILPDTSKYDAVMFGWQSTSMAVGESDANYRTGGQNNFYGYSNAEVDKLFGELQVTTDAAKQTEILGKVEKILVDDAFGTTIFQFPEIATSSKKLKNVTSIPLSPNFFWNAWEWEIA